MNLYQMLQEELLKYIATNYEERNNVVESIEMGAIVLILDLVEPMTTQHTSNRRKD